MIATNYLVAPAGWTQEDPNPFTADGEYDPQWSCFRIRDGQDAWVVNRRWDNGLYAVVAGRDSHLLARTLSEILADFLRYEAAQGRQVILSVPADVDPHRLALEALEQTPEGPLVRGSDQRWLVHSTTRQGWRAICECGELRSLARLRREGVATGGVGFDVFGEPADYAEYVMLGNAGVMAPEFVVASHNAGAIITEEDTPYEPGARLFFDGHRLIREGLIVRDGLHGAKVLDRLPLAPYLVAAVTAADLDARAVWTPREFCLAALERFSETVGEAVPYEHWI